MLSHTNFCFKAFPTHLTSPFFNGSHFCTPLHCGKQQVTLWCFPFVFPHLAHWNKISHGISLNDQLTLALSMSGFHSMEMMDFHHWDPLMPDLCCSPGQERKATESVLFFLATLIFSLTMVDVSSHGRFRGGNLKYHVSCMYHVGPSPPTRWKDEYPSISTATGWYRTPISSQQFCLPAVHCGFWSNVPRMLLQSEGLVCLALSAYINSSMGPFCQLWTNQSVGG